MTIPIAPPPAIRIDLPDWLPDFLARAPERLATDDAAMALAIALARENVARGSGGPFAALVLEGDGGRLVAAGVNRVLASRCSAAHAEILALSLAQQRSGGPDLGAALAGGCTLITTTEPCAMCLGALPWAGITRLVCGARDADARAAGFDEGDKPPDWPGALARRGIDLVRDCRRGQAAAVLLDYVRAGGVIYGPDPPMGTPPQADPHPGR
jgi:tRNA(Arg) A34 adenosine deaminase TadA